MSVWHISNKYHITMTGTIFVSPFYKHKYKFLYISLRLTHVLNKYFNISYNICKFYWYISTHFWHFYYIYLDQDELILSTVSGRTPCEICSRIFHRLVYLINGRFNFHIKTSAIIDVLSKYATLSHTYLTGDRCANDY